MKPRLITACLVALSFIGPVIGSTGAVRADDIKDDTRLAGYAGKSMTMDIGAAPYFLLLAGLGIIGLSVLFKDAKRSVTTK